MPLPDDRRGFFGALIGDGRPLLVLTALSLIFSGGFVIFQPASGEFLPQDVAFLGMTAHDLCRLDQCRIVHFMFHDRVSFGGALIAIGALYLWLAEFPLKAGEAWAWWLFVISGVVGFSSFLAYLGYGYLDTWHGVATLLLLPCFAAGVLLSRKLVREPRSIRSLFQTSVRVPWNTRLGMARTLLLTTALLLVAGGLSILVVGCSFVFVPQDLQFMGMSAAELRAVNPHLVPLIAHDRAGFGGGLCCIGVTVFFCVRCGRSCASPDSPASEPPSASTRSSGTTASLTSRPRW